MGNYEQLKQSVAEVIKANGNQEITGTILQSALLSIISVIGYHATFAGVANPATNPGTPDSNVFYLAAEPGIYANFGGIELTEQVLVLFNKNGDWEKKDSGIATSVKVKEIENTCGKIQSHKLYPINDGYYYAPFKIEQGNKYTIRIKRINDVNGTVQFKTSTIQNTSGFVDTLENLSFSETEKVQSFIASSDANYIASYAAIENIQVVLTLDPTYTNEAIETEKNRAIGKENELQTQITNIENKSKGTQLRNAISNLVNPNNFVSAINWFFCDSMIVKNSKVTIAKFISLNAGVSTIGLWKYENNQLELMETFDVTANGVNETVDIDNLLERVFDYDCFVAATNTEGTTGCMGINTINGNRLYFPKDGRTDIGSIVDFTETDTASGALSMRITYSIPIDNSPTDTNNQGILEVGATKRYKTIQEAVNVANDGNTILVYPGVYDEQVQATSKTLHIVGVNKYSCILRDRSSNYYTPPIEIQSGSITNMSIYETADMPTDGLENIIIPGTSLNAKNMAYCIHADWDYNVKSNNELVIDNCILRNANRPCIGAGLHENSSLKVRRCIMYSGISDEGKGRGAFYCHAAADGEEQQFLELLNNVIECEDAIAMELRGYDGGNMYVTAYNNIVYSSIDGKQDSAINQNFGTGLTLLSKSYGNNISILNA